MKWLAKLDRIAGKTLLALAMACMIGLFLILIGNVIVRQFSLGSFMGWYSEVAEILFAWMVMLIASVLCRNKEHFQIDLLKMKLGRKRGFYVLAFFTNLIALVFFLYLLYYGAKLTQGASQTMPILRIEKRWAYLCLPFNAFFLSVYSLRDVIESLLYTLGKKPLPSGTN